MRIQTTNLADEFIEMLDAWHASTEKWDNALDAQIHRQYAEVLTRRKFLDFKSQPYFSPSSANSCKRELYVKLRGGKRDVSERPAYQGRWTRIGTAIGDVIQRDLLFIEKHAESPTFVPVRTAEGYPMWEDFAKELKVVTHNGVTFALFGTPDGILTHTPTGNRVGLEIKSKQTTAAKTSLYSLKEPQEDHVKQVIAYSIMYGVDDYIITYVNAAKKSWVMSDDDYEKNPDVRAFHIHVTDSDRQALLDNFADVVRAAHTGEPPALELDKWTFNSYKTACALDISDEEFAELQAQVVRIKKSRMPDWKKMQYVEALNFIEEVRNKGAE